MRDPRHDPTPGDVLEDAVSLVTVEAVGAWGVEGTRGAHRALRGWSLGSWRLCMATARVVERGPDAPGEAA